MTDMSKKMIIGSWVFAAIVLLLALADLILGTPFGRFSTVMDILFLISAAMVAYLGWDAWKDLR